MKPIPSDPFAFQARIMEALIADIRDPKAKSFPRLDALRSINSTRGSEHANNVLDSNQ